MKKVLFNFLLAAVVFLSCGVVAGELVYRDGFFNSECQDIKSHPKIGGRGGSYYDTTRTVHSLVCDGQVISVVTMPSPVCSPRGGGCYTQLVTCGARGCVSHVERVNDTVNYDFNYWRPDVSEKLGTYTIPDVEVVFGTISRKSTANVFSSRPLAKNYLAFSSDGVLDKPVIVVEGYDPTDNIYPQMYYGSGFNQLLLNGVNNNGSNGRDVFIVNFPHGAAKISENAALLEKIILEINGAKIGNIPTAVIGYSMGGLVARKALKKMELAGIDHKTALYISYDAPHLGANAPLDIQNTVDALVDKLDDYAAGYTSSSLKRARYIYNSPAAREMLIAAPEFISAKPSDFPEKLVRIAVTSGSLLGIAGKQVNSVYEGENVAAFRFYLWKSSGGALLPSSSLSESFDWYSKKRGGVYYDNVPGSYAESFSEAYWKLKDGAASFDRHKDAAVQNITFVPTISALAMPVEPNTELKGLFSVKSPFDKYIAVDETPSMNPCDSFRLQSADGKNIYHSIEDSYLNYNQLMQLRCALDTYQVQGFKVPDRSFKRY